ncbi:MAG TPA: adenylate/guanylate cyclase domain-containing protein, partial [Actinomycetota bacterium]|nr:adenylate/guanylate cyclase domain-containing protein [Actinomycetota bacterium]
MGAANGGAQPPTEIRAFLIADIRGYTVFTNERGDDAAGRLAALFAAVVREEVEPFDGDLLELRGDEALVVFTSPRQAIRAAVRLQDRCIDETLADPSMPLTVGIGLDAGEAVAVEGGYRGGALNLAARLCSKARAGEVLASQGILHLARRVEGIAYRDAGQLELKGLDEPVRVSLVAPVGADRSHLVAVYVPRPPSRRRRGRVAVAVVALVAVVAGGVAAVVAATGGDDGQAAATSPAASRPASP